MKSKPLQNHKMPISLYFKYHTNIFTILDLIKYVLYFESLFMFYRVLQCSIKHRLFNSKVIEKRNAIFWFGEITSLLYVNLLTSCYLKTNVKNKETETFFFNTEFFTASNINPRSVFLSCFASFSLRNSIYPSRFFKRSFWTCTCFLLCII